MKGGFYIPKKTLSHKARRCNLLCTLQTIKDCRPAEPMAEIQAAATGKRKPERP
jgi:hypothetical protein